MNASSTDKRVSLALRRAAVVILDAGRRVLASIFQIVFKDRLRDISEKTDRLGSASVESVTYLGGEVRSLDQRLAKIEAELAAIRELLESQEDSPQPTEAPEQITAGPSGG